MTSIPLPTEPPETVEYEQGLIGGCLVDTRGVEVWPTLRPEEFFLERHRVIWQAMLDLTEVTAHPTLLDVTDELRRSGRLADAGGVAEVAELLERGMLVFDLAHYGQVIRDAATRRLKIQFAASLMQRPDMATREAEEMLRRLESVQAERPQSVSKSLREMQQRIATEPLIRTGIPAVDTRLYGGISRGITLVVGGRTSHGKTAFCVQFARMAAQGGITVEYLSLEEPPEAIQARVIANLSRVPLVQIRRGSYGPDEYPAVERAISEAEMLPLTMTSVRMPTEDAVIGVVASSAADMVIVDHLQHVIMDAEKRNYELERVMARLAAVAVADRKLVVIAAQLSRAVDQRKEPPTLADLRDSGGIEQIARMIFLLYWPIRHDGKRNPLDYEIVIAKNSEGPTGSVSIDYDARSGRFTSGEES